MSKTYGYFIVVNTQKDNAFVEDHWTLKEAEQARDILNEHEKRNNRDEVYKVIPRHEFYFLQS